MPIGLLNAGDRNTGIATCTTALTADNNTGTSQYTDGVVVTGYYVRDTAEGNTVINTAQPIPSNFITGGDLVLSTSAGQVSEDQRSKANFGFNVKHNKSGTDLLGNVNIIVRGGGHVYQIKGNAIFSLGVAGATANFGVKANIQDITDPLNPISIESNAALQVCMTEGDDLDTSGTFGIQVLSKNGGMWFSSNWSGTKTVEQTLSTSKLD